MRNGQCRTWNMARKLKIVEKETQTLFDLEYREKHSKTWKMRNTNLGPGMWGQTQKNMENKKETL